MSRKKKPTPKKTPVSDSGSGEKDKLISFNDRGIALEESQEIEKQNPIEVVRVIVDIRADLVQHWGGIVIGGFGYTDKEKGNLAVRNVSAPGFQFDPTGDGQQVINFNVERMVVNGTES